MNRQRNITLAQIEAKMYDAEARVRWFLLKSMEAKSEQKYESYLDQMNKAASDYTIWSKVFRSLA